MRGRVFAGWFVVLALVWVVANWPRTFGLAGFFEQAGFPLVFALWAGGGLHHFDPDALAIDCALGAAFVLGASWACARSRASGREGEAPAEPVRRA
jgi:hypothetical protein